MPSATVWPSPASARIPASTGPTQGAAHRPNAPPRSAAEPVLRALHETRREQAVEEGQRQQPHHGEAEDDDDEPRDREEHLPVLAEQAPRCRRGCAERDEDRGEAGHERQARENDAPAANAHVLA